MFVSVHVLQQQMELRFHLISHLGGDLTRLSKWRYLSAIITWSMKQKNDTFYINKKKCIHDVFELQNIYCKHIFTKASTDTLIPFYSPDFTKMRHHITILGM